MKEEKNYFGFCPDKRITEVLKEEDFLLSAEIVPPRNGTNHRRVVDQLKLLLKQVPRCFQ